MSVSINAPHVPSTHPWQILKSIYLIVGPSESQRGVLSLIFVFFLPFKIPLVVTLVSTVVAAGWVTAWIFHMHAAARSNANHNETSNNIVYPCENPRPMAGRGNCLS